jgi:aminopeptidase N
MAASVEKVLLPSSVSPVHYDLEITPDLERLEFSGNVSINVQVSADTRSVTLHSKEIQVLSAAFTSKSSPTTKLALEEIAYNLTLKTVRLGFDGALPMGEGVLSIEFRGILNGDMAGFYKSGYADVDGKRLTMASTQFEALDARRAFPCWDEPAAKATFSLTLIVDSELTAISNMPELRSMYLPNNKKRVEFDVSPKMSTYLLAWAVGKFDYIQGKTTHGVTVRIFTPPGRAEEGRFALDVGIKSLDFYDDYFQVPYPLPKLDMLCCTEFAMGAMENWGLVTYREVDLMIDEAKASSQQKQRVAIVVAHELGHQWFGNLVTMAWWDDLWLNEGFASYSEHLTVDALFPSWNIWEQFTTDAMGAALRLDALRTSHPIQVPIGHAEEVEQVSIVVLFIPWSLHMQ